MDRGGGGLGGALIEFFLLLLFSFSWKHVFLLFDYYHYGVRQFLAKKNEKFSGNPPPPVVECRINMYYENKDACKNLELKILKSCQKLLKVANSCQ